MALIGLHTKKPKHAYEIVNDIKDRYMGDWTVISMSSAHKHLNALEKKKFLETELKPSKNNVAQKVYSLINQVRRRDLVLRGNIFHGLSFINLYLSVIVPVTCIFAEKGTYHLPRGITFAPQALGVPR